MKSERGDFLGFLFLSVILAIFSVISVSYAATISGTVYKHDGLNPVNDATIAVNVYEGSPCGSYQLVAQGTTVNGAFAIAGLSPGTYYLKTVKVSGTANYVDKWWAGAGSIWDCEEAGAVTISNPGDVLSGKNFQLDLYGSISGSVYDANGNPIKESQILDVTAFRGSTCENSKWIGVQDWLTEKYKLTKVPPGTYYVKSSNKGSVWFIDEYHTVSGNTNNGISYSCTSATQVTVSSGMDTPNIDFQLDSGGRISGTVYKSDGATPITDAFIRIFAYEGGACNGRQYVDGTATSNGNYVIGGLPAGSYYIQSFRESGANYLGEWYNTPLSSSNCNDADIVKVWVGAETKNINFQMDSGGSITGRLVDESGQPLGGVKVEYDSNETVGGWFQTWSDQSDGTFTISGIGPGDGQITIFSDPGRYLAGFRRVYYWAQGENKDIGTLKVQKGAVIKGMVTKGGVPLHQLQLSVGAKLTMDRVDTAADGTFSFVLPPGEFTIFKNDITDPFTTVPQKVVVTEADIMTNKTIPNIVAYDLSSGDVYNGTVTINNIPPTGAGIMIMSFMNDQKYDLNNWGATNPLSLGGSFDGSKVSNPYQLASPPNSTVRLGLILYKRHSDQNESITLTDSVSAVSGGGIYNLTYNNIGSTVDGYVFRQGKAVFWASFALYRQQDNEFIGFARTDHTGHYVLYNIPDGTYGIEATAEDFDGIYKMPAFDINGNLTINITLNNTPPTVTIGAPSVAITNSGPVTYIVSYTSADTVTLAAANVTLNKTGTANGNFAVSGAGNTTRMVTISNITGDGTLGISIAAGTASDTAGNLAAAAGPSTIFRIAQPGDVNLSGDVDIADAILAAQVLSGMTPVGIVYKETDVNGDGKIGIAEVIYILQKASGIR